ncbi:hypothetical protein [Aquincola agrisoli]|uniref:hypothetical protein n=1 Tax=Aquincola TaxID=391952 RepID=UPI002FBF1E57
MRRYERAAAGELLRLNMKKFGGIAQLDHRGGGAGNRRRSAGWQSLPMAIGDHSRVGLSLVLADEASATACMFLPAALRYCERLGVVRPV